MGYGCDSFVFCEFPLGAVSVGACVEAGRVGRASSSRRISCGDCWDGQWVCREHPHRAGSFLPRYHVCLLCSQSPLQGPFPWGPSHKGCVCAWWLSAADVPIPVSTENTRECFCAHTKARISLGQWVNNDWVVLGKNQDGLADQCNPLIRVNWTLIHLLAVSKQAVWDMDAALSHGCVLVQSMGARVKIRAVWALWGSIHDKVCKRIHVSWFAGAGKHPNLIDLFEGVCVM